MISNDLVTVSRKTDTDTVGNVHESRSLQKCVHEVSEREKVKEFNYVPPGHNLTTKFLSS